MQALLDVNVLIALFQPDHVHHQAAHRWWSANRGIGWASCPLTQNGFIRIVSQPRYAMRLALQNAMSKLHLFIAQTDHAFWADDISLLDAALFQHDHMLGPKQLTDIYLLGLALKNGGRLATLDRTIPIGAVRGAGPEHVAVI
jgi:uncharacterized protein